MHVVRINRKLWNFNWLKSFYGRKNPLVMEAAYGVEAMGAMVDNWLGVESMMSAE